MIDRMVRSIKPGERVLSIKLPSKIFNRCAAMTQDNLLHEYGVKMKLSTIVSTPGFDVAVIKSVQQFLIEHIDGDTKVTEHLFAKRFNYPQLFRREIEAQAVRDEQSELEREVLAKQAADAMPAMILIQVPKDKLQEALDSLRQVGLQPV